MGKTQKYGVSGLCNTVGRKQEFQGQGEVFMTVDIISKCVHRMGGPGMPLLHYWAIFFYS